MDSTRGNPRPFTSPASVSIAALTLVALAAASFTSGLTRQLRHPRADNTAKVVVLAPKEAPPTGTVVALADIASAAPPPARVPARPRHRPDSTPTEPLPIAPTEAPAAAPAAPLAAADVSAVAPVAPPLAPEAAPDPEPAPPAAP